MKKTRTKNKKHKIMRAVKGLSLILVCGAIILFLAKYGEYLKPENVTDFINRNIINAGMGEGYPINLPSGEAKNIGTIGDDVSFLTDTHIYTFDKTGKELTALLHGLNNVQIERNNSKSLLFELEGKSFLITTSARIVDKKNVNGNIINANIADNGYAGVITTSDKYLSEITVYNKSLKQIFCWYMADYQGFLLDFTPNSRNIVTASMNAVDGQIVSYIDYFPIKKEKVKWSKSYIGSMPVSLSVKKNNNTSVIFDNKAVVLDTNGNEKFSYQYNSPLKMFANSDTNLTVLVFDDYTDMQKNTIAVIDMNGQKLYDLSVSEDIKQLEVYDSNIFVLTQNNLYIYKSTGELMTKVEKLKDTVKFTMNKSYIYIETLTTIEQLSYLS